MISKNILFLIIILSGSLQAQMFSIGGSSESREPSSSQYLMIGYSPVDFSLEGEPSIQNSQNRLDFSSSAFHIGIETPGLNASLSFVNKLTGAKDERYLNLSLDYINRFSFIRSSSFQFGVPLGLKTSLLNVQNEQINNDFSQTVFGLGVGAFTSFRIPNKLIFSVEGIPSYGFSNSSGGLFGGSNKSLVASARLNFLNIFLGRNLSVGYDYNYSSYDLDDDSFDYDLNSHLITIGVSL